MKKMRMLGKEFCGEDIYELLVNHLPDMVHAVDDSGKIIYANYTSEITLGYTADEMKNMHVSELYAEDLRDDVIKGFDNLKETGFKKGKS